MTRGCPRSTIVAVGLALGIVAPSGPVPAQAAGGLAGQAVVAYQNLDFAAAAGLLRRALAPPVGDSLSTTERAQLLTYLAATEWFRERRDSAAAAFRRVVLLDPRYRPDPLIFPPAVTRLFSDVRQRTRAVAVRVPPDTVIPLVAGRLAAWIVASSPHDIRVEVAREDGRPVRTLYAGPIGDSLEVHWDARDSTGALAPAGALLLRVTSSRGGGGGVATVSQLPLELEVPPLDTLPHPADLTPSDFKRERATRGTALRSLSGGLLLGAAAVALPQMVAPGGRSSGSRWALAGALSVSGLIGYLSQPSGRPLPGNVAANRARRAEWQRRSEAVQRENAARLRDAELRIHAGQAAVIERAPV